MTEQGHVYVYELNTVGKREVRKRRKEREREREREAAKVMTTKNEEQLEPST